jgi:hypothetical protein
MADEERLRDTNEAISANLDVYDEERGLTAGRWMASRLNYLALALYWNFLCVAA